MYVVGYWAPFLLLVLFLLPTPVAADWLQPDPAGTGMTSEAGPEWPDVAFTIDFDPAATARGPVVIDRQAYLAATFASGTFFEGAVGNTSLVRVDLDTAAVHWLAELPPVVRDGPDGPYLSEPHVAALASDGDTLYVVRQTALVSAYGLDGTLRWEVSIDPLDNASSTDASPPKYTTFVAPCTRAGLVVAAGNVTVACDWYESAVFVARVAAGGTLEWSQFVGGAPDHHDAPSDPQDAVPFVQSLGSEQDLPASELVIPAGLAVADGHIAVGRCALVDVDRGIGGLAGQQRLVDAQCVYHLLEEDGNEVWQQGPLRPMTNAVQQFVYAASPVFAGGRLVMEHGDLVERSLANTGVAPDRSLEFRPDGETGDAGGGLALAPEGLYVTSQRTLFLLDAAWTTKRQAEAPSGLEWGAQPLVRASNAVYAGAGLIGEADNVLVAMRPGTLEHMWAVSFERRANFAITDGVAVVLSHHHGGTPDNSPLTLTVLGTTPASLPIDVEISNRYPGPGESVTVDLGATGAGALGAPTEYRASWGDGTETEWQTDPVLNHKYSDIADRHARFEVRNAANQTASVPMTFYVGQMDPSITMWNSPFHQEFQETSFFLLGLLVTAAVAGIGIYRAGRKRRRFQRELRALEEDYKRLATDAPACDAMLSERKSGARALFLDKRIEEAHASFLERRIDELRRSLRLGTIEEQLSFLPHGMVVHLQRLLADARIEAWERKHFLAALDGQKEISAAQRGLARKVIDDWFARDMEVRT